MADACAKRAFPGSTSVIPLTSPIRSYLSQREQIDAAIRRVLASGNYLMGRELQQFEEEFAKYLGVNSVVGVNSGTDGLAIALTAIGVGRGDEVITVSHTAVATVSAIEQVGAIPILVDVENNSRTIDFDQVHAHTTAKTRAVIPVHLYGMPANMGAAISFRNKTGIPIIEDCSQAHGARWLDQYVGTFGEAAVFSCYPTKNLGALGDAGLIATQNSDLAAKMRRIRQYGWQRKQFSIESGFNSRLDEIQAAILRVKLQVLTFGNERRRELAARYDRELAGLPIARPRRFSERHEVFHLYVCEVPNRDDIVKKLENIDIATGVHYPHPVHLQPAFDGRIKVGAMENTVRLCTSVISLPMFPELSDSEVDRVVSGLERVLS